MVYFTITKDWLNKHQTRKGGYTKKQIESLNLPWPPPPKWKKEVTGKRINATSRVIFEESKEAVSDDKTIRVKCLMRHFSKSQLKAIDNYIKRLLIMDDI